MAKPRTVDIHNHILTTDAMARLARLSPKVAPLLKGMGEEAAEIMEIDGRVMQVVVPRGIWDVERRLRDMDRHGVDVQVLTHTTQTFYYEEEPALAAECAAVQNEDIAGVVKRHPDRFVGFAALPMQAPDLAAAELRRVVRTYGMRGAHLASNIAGRNLDDPALEPVWEAAVENDFVFFVHPNNYATRAERMGRYYLANFVGLPFETTLAAASLVFGGVLERYPNLKFVLAHGGGYVPYQRGRFIHGWEVRPEPKVNLKESPEASLSRLYFDTITHSPAALRFLVETAGADHVLLGSDYPFDMGNFDCVAKVKAAGLPVDQEASILGSRAAALLGLK
ncbi:MAG TPA: amidohydrolase family protein [Xanthobacteraceae bacterium]|nr:amidohydrolase family protein [Xanthobacteraceae bacterium]